MVLPSYHYPNGTLLQELIKVRGWQVSPTEIETCLLQHPRILDAAVIGVGFPDVQVELPRAYIVVDSKPPSNPLSDGEIHDHVGSQLAKYKSLTGGIRRIDSIPKSAAGKMLKKVLREAAAKEAVEQECVKHVEQPIPVDKNYFEHVEHVELAGPRTADGMANANGRKTGNGIANGNESTAKITTDGKIQEAEANAYGPVGDKKRKHEANMNGANGVGHHKRTKSHANGIKTSIENGTRRSSRINGKVA